MCFTVRDEHNLFQDAESYVEILINRNRLEFKTLFSHLNYNKFKLFREHVLHDLSKNIDNSRDWATNKNSQRRLFLTMLIEMAALEYSKANNLGYNLGTFRDKAYENQQWLKADSSLADVFYETHVYTGNNQPPENLQNEKESKMNPTTVAAATKFGFNFNEPAIEKRTFIFGVETSQLSKEAVYGLIEVLESRIEALDKIKNKPNTLKADIKAYQAQIEELIRFVDKKLPN